MLVFSKNKYIDWCIKRYGQLPSPMAWVDRFDGKQVEQDYNGEYREVDGSLLAEPEWVAEVNDKYL